MRDSISEGEVEIKQLHSQYMDLKGAIVVYIRPRQIAEEIEVITTKNNRTITVAPEPRKPLAPLKTTSTPNRALPMSFNYDYVFTTEDTNLRVYKEFRPYIRGAFDGFKSCLFSYGQTGSGKSYSMFGK